VRIRGNPAPDQKRRITMTQDSTSFSVSDLEYNLITTLSNLLQSEEVLARYTKDAEDAGEQDIAESFRRLRAHNGEVAVRMRQELQRLIAKD
jgi:predicted component of type VI protein secretion system